MHKMFDMSDFYRTNSQNEALPVLAQMQQPDTAFRPVRECKDPLAMVFINVQPFGRVYDTEEAFENGTLFPDFNKPFMGGEKYE